MRFLIDTNILVYREDSEPLKAEIAEVLQVIQADGHQMVVHPESSKELSRDSNLARREITLSKVASYPLLDQPPVPPSDWLSRVGVSAGSRSNDLIDAYLIYAVSQDAVDFMITNDAGLRNRAEKALLGDRVLSVLEARDLLISHEARPRNLAPRAIKFRKAHSLNRDDPIFDPLKNDYPEFGQWWQKVCRQHRDTWVYERPDDTLGALMLLKEENESIPLIDFVLEARPRIKIATLIVQETGFRLGELFIRLAIEKALEKNCQELYLTHFEQEPDELILLIERFGFELVGRNDRGEGIYLKQIWPSDSADQLSPIEVARKYYPSFKCGRNVAKYVVPIQAPYHERLFPTFEQQGERNAQPELPFKGVDELVVEGNAIRKAYLCHSKIRSIRSGDLIVFYRSIDLKSLVTLAVVEEAHTGVVGIDHLNRVVGKVSVYTQNELADMGRKETLVLLFKWICHFPNRIRISKAKEAGYLKGAPQSVSKLNDDIFPEILKEAQVDERIIIDSP